MHPHSHPQECPASRRTASKHWPTCENAINFEAISAGRLSSLHVPLDAFLPFLHFGESGCNVTSTLSFSSTSDEPRQGTQRAQAVGAGSLDTATAANVLSEPSTALGIDPRSADTPAW